MVLHSQLPCSKTFAICCTNIAEMAMFYIKLTSLSDFPLEERPISPTGQFKQSFESLYVTDSPLSVTYIVEMAMFHIKLTSLSDFSHKGKAN